MPNGSRRLVLPAPSPGFAVAGAPLEVFPSCIPSARARKIRPPGIGLACSEPSACRRSRRIVSSRESACVAPPPFNDAASTPRHPRVSFGVLVPPSPSCSALMVSHHLDGLLRCFACESVSPRSGPGVHDLAGVPSRPPPKRQGQADLSSRARTLRSLSPPAAAPCHHGPCHPDVAHGESWRRPSVGPRGSPLPAQGSSNPPRWASTSPPRPGSAATTDESAVLQVCHRDPRSEDRTCAEARSSRRASAPSANDGGFRPTGTERSPSWRCSADEYMMPHPYGPDIRSFHGFCPLRGFAAPSLRPTVKPASHRGPCPRWGNSGPRSRAPRCPTVRRWTTSRHPLSHSAPPRGRLVAGAPDPKVGFPAVRSRA